MADEPTPAFNQDALAREVRGAVVGGMQDFARQAHQQNAAVQQQQRAAQVQQQAAGDPIYNAVVKPYIEPALRHMNVQTQGAIDAVGFYAENPDALRHRQVIETQFNQMASNNMPFDRATIYNHFRGQPGNFEQFAKEYQDQLQRAAAQGATVGAPGVGRPGGLPVLDANAAKGLSFEDLERAVKSRMF